VFVEAADKVEELMLQTLARAQSPAAVDLLLDQPRRWRAAQDRRDAPLPGGRGSLRDTVLRRLIEPALVVAVGPPNIGKSSLLNALAGRGVAVVADEPGTTRDHVGALIDLAGVVVRWVDTPGLEEGKAKNEKRKTKMDTGDAAIQAEAQRLAREVAARADVLLVCSDANDQIEPPHTKGALVRVGLRSDLGMAAGVEAAVSVRTATGLERLVEVVREAVVPHQYLEDAKPWVFWEEKDRHENERRATILP
jgi:tRNA U34 5-carboxymethylaminomethyl modifying GTPase MnmE/TrmE